MLLYCNADVNDSMAKVKVLEVVEDMDDAGRHEHDDNEPHTSSFSHRHKKKLVISFAAVLILFVAVVAITTRRHSDTDNDTKFDIQMISSSSTAMDVNYQAIATTRQSSSNTNECQPNEGLWNLILTTDDYPYETKWELHDGDNNNILAFGPPQGKKYEKLTRYIGNLCIPHGKYYMRWFDLRMMEYVTLLVREIGQ